MSSSLPPCKAGWLAGCASQRDVFIFIMSVIGCSGSQRLGYAQPVHSAADGWDGISIDILPIVATYVLYVVAAACLDQ